MANRILTLGFLNCPEIPPRELVEVAARAGFRSVGIRITGRRVGDPYAEIVGNSRAIAAIREEADAHAIRLSNISAYHLYPDVTLREVVPVLDAAQALQADLLVISCYDADYERFCTMLRGYADAAAQRAVRLAIEFVPFSKAPTLDHALRIVDRVGRDNLGLVIDPLHLARSGGQPNDLARIPANRFFLAQLCDAWTKCPEGVDLATEARTLRLPPGQGALPVDEVLDALPAHLELECEFPTEENLRLDPEQRARRIYQEATGYLTRYKASRGNEHE